MSIDLVVTFAAFVAGMVAGAVGWALLAVSDGHD